MNQTIEQREVPSTQNTERTERKESPEASQNTNNETIPPPNQALDGFTAFAQEHIPKSIPAETERQHEARIIDEVSVQLAFDEAIEKVLGPEMNQIAQEILADPALGPIFKEAEISFSSALYFSDACNSFQSSLLETTKKDSEKKLQDINTEDFIKRCDAFIADNEKQIKKLQEVFYADKPEEQVHYIEESIKEYEKILLEANETALETKNMALDLQKKITTGSVDDEAILEMSESASSTGGSLYGGNYAGMGGYSGGGGRSKGPDSSRGKDSYMARFVGFIIDTIGFKSGAA